MGKLVRDRIPEIIRAEGDATHTRVLDGEGFRSALLDKLVEEAQELRDATREAALDEAADVYEVLVSFASLQGWSLEQVAARASGKRAERGGFDERIYLESFTSTRAPGDAS